jgi:uncharacterized SAM-binding protein YcdF (DUF218 family)
LGIHRIILVTDAIHLRRAELCFRKQGFDIIPSGCNYGASQFNWSPLTFLPTPGAATSIRRALHEWIGILYYRVRGRL